MEKKKEVESCRSCWNEVHEEASRIDWLSRAAARSLLSIDGKERGADAAGVRGFISTRVSRD